LILIITTNCPENTDLRFEYKSVSVLNKIPKAGTKVKKNDENHKKGRQIGDPEDLAKIFERLNDLRELVRKRREALQRNPKMTYVPGGKQKQA